VVTFGDRMRRERESRGWTQKQFAEKAGVPQETISRLETGKHRGPHIDVAVKLAKALKVSLDYLAGRYEEDESELEPAGVALVGA
jgi:transcriptional regulator with XRE-family HTH domain